MRITVDILLILATAAVAGCGSGYEEGILTSYGEGYSDGCDSAYSDIGIAGFEYSSGGLFGGEYGSGWDEGYRDCEAFMRAAAL